MGGWGEELQLEEKGGNKREIAAREMTIMSSCLLCNASPFTWNDIRLIVQLVNTCSLSVNLNITSEGRPFVSLQAELITPIHTYTCTYS